MIDFRNLILMSIVIFLVDGGMCSLLIWWIVLSVRSWGCLFIFVIIVFIKFINMVLLVWESNLKINEFKE